jgi:hypothetical protein
MAPANIKRISRKFYDDHVERDLPAPSWYKQSRLYIWIDTTPSPEFDELVDDARYYAETTQGWTPEAKQYVYAARKMLTQLGLEW